MAFGYRCGTARLLRSSLLFVLALTAIIYVANSSTKTTTISSGDAEHIASRVLQEALSAEILPLAAELPVDQAAPLIAPAVSNDAKPPETQEVAELPLISQGGMDEILDQVPDLEVKAEEKKVEVEKAFEKKAEPVKVAKEAKPNEEKRIVSVKKVEVSQSVEKKVVSVVSVSSRTNPVEQLENPPVLTSTLYAGGHSISSKICDETKGSNLRLLVLVTSAPGHVLERAAVRGTWGHVALRKDVALAFFVGQSKNATENQQLKDESYTYDDVIQGNFVDTYNNLTLKTISMLEWISEHCSRTRFVLKTDDDMFINFPPLLKLLGAVKRPRLIFGKLAQKWKPIRNISSKYYIPPRLYSDEYYPDFNTGPAYVLTGDIIKELYRESLNGIFYKLEDVYVTGIIAKKLKIDHMNFEEFINRRVSLETCKVKNAISIHMVKTFEMYDLWKRLSDGLEKCDKPIPKKVVKTTPKTKPAGNT